MIKLFTDDAWEDDCHWERLDKKTLRRINSLLKDMIEMAMGELANLSHSKVTDPVIGAEGSMMQTESSIKSKTAA